MAREGNGSARMVCDISECEILFRNLTGKEIIGAKKKALRAGSVVITRKTRNLLPSQGFKFRSYMKGAVAYKVDRKGIKSTVHLFGKMKGVTSKGKMPDRSLMQYFNLGTKERIRKTNALSSSYIKRREKKGNARPGYHGKLKQYNFLEEGTDQGKTEAEGRIGETMEMEIKRISFLKK